MPSIYGAARATYNFLTGRKRDYIHTFKSSVAGQRVLQDLAKFCRANETCFHEDARLHAVLEGRREVFLRITQHLNLTSEQLYAVFAGHVFNPEEDTDDET